MDINVLSAYQTTAQDFFDRLKAWSTDLVLDVRLKNTNQLAGFTKQEESESIPYPRHLTILRISNLS